MSDEIDDSVLDAVANAKPTATSNWFQPGSYLLEVQNLLWRGLNFIAEFKVLEATSTGEINRATKEPFVPNAPGSFVSLVVPVKPGDPKDSGPGNIIAFLMGLTGAPKEKLTRAAIKQLTSELQPCKLMQVKDTPFNKPQKGDPTKDFTHHRWETVPSTDPRQDANKAHRAVIKPEMEKRMKAAQEAAAKAAAEAAAKAAQAPADGEIL